MDPTSREDLSALMDGELAAEPTRFLLRRLDHDPELGATWSRWHLIRACLASDSARMSAQRRDNDFAAGVAAALETESAPPSRTRHWARYLGGGAIAASVAVAALMLNVPASRIDAPAPVAQDRPVSNPVGSALAATGLAAAPAKADAGIPPWLLSRQPTVFGAQPASANVVYGTGLMQPDYLQRATYSRDAAPYASLQAGQPRLPFSIVLLPEQPPASASASRH
ncbi:MAG TPA: sigma-E factor negative regulatory protein [Rhodanobacteraceae bacterium]|jgi:sigma-E factor negative regulatory protein RseA|nr:sigma-E factor negative regulatory protein [Rhodanobacteraceae bacterium]